MSILTKKKIQYFKAKLFLTICLTQELKTQSLEELEGNNNLLKALPYPKAKAENTFLTVNHIMFLKTL